MKKTYCGVAALLLTVTMVLCCIGDYSAACKNVREGVLRLHVTANSDSAEDQAVKLAVRDALLQSGSEIFDGSVTARDAREKLTPRLAEIEKTACGVLADNGFPYGARAYIVNEYFEARDYNGVTLPAGNYTALRVALGSGEGKNWWCVMFPPLCLPAACADDADAFAVFSGDGANVVKAANGYKIRFKIVESAEKLFEKIRSRSEK